MGPSAANRSYSIVEGHEQTYDNNQGHQGPKNIRRGIFRRFDMSKPQPIGFVFILLSIAGLSLFLAYPGMCMAGIRGYPASDVLPTSFVYDL